MTFERKSLRKIHEKRKNVDLNRLYGGSNLQDFLRSKKLECKFIKQEVNVGWTE